jgi:hypothetical protein
MDPTPDRFRGLARSSPWRWRSLRFTARWLPESPPAPLVRAWVRRPGALRVEGIDGALLQASTEAGACRSEALLSRGRPEPGALPRVGDAEPVWDPDGLVAQRPTDASSIGDPMFRDYLWVSLLDPVELADALAPEIGPAAEVDDLIEVDHHGRPAWQAVLRPTPGYDPRCSCCALLFSETSEARSAQGGGPTARELDPDLRYPDAHRVRLDVGTGVCVLLEQLGGSRAGTVTELVIEAVDQPMDDTLFATPPRRRGIARVRRA